VKDDKKERTMSNVRPISRLFRVARCETPF